MVDLFQASGASGAIWAGRRRTAQEALDAMPGAIEAGESFRARVVEAAGDASRLAGLMAEAIAMDRASRGLEVVGRDGRARLSLESLQAAYCMDAARAAYLRAIGSNEEPADGA